jgi:hypothetical protein
LPLGLASIFGKFFGQVRGDGAVIGRRAGKDFGGEFSAQGQGGLAGFGNLFADFSVIRRVDDDGDAVVVFGGAAKHGGAADVDIFDGVVQGDIGFGDSLFEGVEVDDDEVDGLDAVFAGGGFVTGVAADVEQTAVDFGVKRFDAAIEHFGKTGVLADVFDGEAGFAKGLGGAAGGDEFHAGSGEGLGEGHEAGFIGNGKQGAANFFHRRRVQSAQRAR